MKKVFYLINITIVSVLLFTSCFEKMDNWYTETSEYDGRFVVSATCEEYSSDDVPLSDGMEMWIFNTAKNAANEIWIDNFSIAGTHIKAKLNVTGNAASFNTAEDTYLVEDGGTYVLNTNGSLAAYPPAAPASAGLKKNCVTLYARIKVDSAFVSKAAATTPGGNKSDSVYLKATLFHDGFEIESYQTGATYSWRIVEGSLANMDGWEEHWTMSGYRYTGFPEDLGKKPPIVVK